MLDSIVSGKYKLTEKLGVAPFYEVFKGKHQHNQTEVAVKIQKRSVSESKLFNEVKIFKDIQGEDAIADLGFPHIFENGNEGAYNYMVMDLLGQSLDKMLFEKGGKIDLKIALDLGQQMIDRIETLHSRGYIHRDLRLEHFLLGKAKKPSRVYMTGLNTAKRYLRSDKKHADYRDNKASFTGTARFLSLNAHMGIEQSRRDDIESFMYILIFMIKGSLPWQKLKANKRYEKYEKIFEVKLGTPVEVVCEGLPQGMEQLLLYAKLMEYEQAPDYLYLKKAMRAMGRGIDQNLVFIEC